MKFELKKYTQKLNLAAVAILGYITMNPEVLAFVPQKYQALSLMVVFLLSMALGSVPQAGIRK